jgi:arylsulfatase A-like enzyme
MLPGWKFDQILPTITAEAVKYIGQRAEQKQPFFLFFTLTSPHEPIQPTAEFRGKSGLNALGDFIIQTDAVVGQITAAIEKHKLADDTLLIFTADNGSSLYTGGNELIRMGHEPSGQFRGHKTSIYEGGHRVPFFARWPGKISAGASSSETICLTDLMATCAALIESTLPSNAGEDSVSVLPLLLNESYKSPLREATVHQSASGQLAIRRGPWKLIEAPRGDGPKRSGEPATAELYHLGDDVTEARNVHDRHPKIVAELTDLLDRYRRTGRSR